MSKERATRRASREAERAAAAAARERRDRRLLRRQARRNRVGAPVRWVTDRFGRAVSSFRRRTKAQRLVIVVAAIAVVAGMIWAPSWGLRVMILGFTALLLPVAWTLVSSRR